jgi:alkanesulfonate monooxygenase SsuD/methylene tetrahydromethanopterin reductase-like flavin-dependent oxidoreductase (luciferase family)
VRRSQALFWESYEIIRKAWAGEPFTHHGEFYDLPVPGWFDTSVDDPTQLDRRYYRENGELYALSVLPTPYQKPGPPTYLMADSVSSYVEAARAGVGAISYGKSYEATREIFQTYRKAADLAADAEVPLGIMRPVFVADSMAEADAVMRPAVNTLMDVLAGIKGRASARKRYLATDEELTDQDRADDWYDFLTRHGWTFCGTADYIIERIKQFQTELGVNHLIQYWALPGFSHDRVMTSLRRFADEVMPAF